MEQIINIALIMGLNYGIVWYITNRKLKKVMVENDNLKDFLIWKNLLNQYHKYKV